MSAKSPGLEARLAEEIARSGPLTFARFMERALYDPEEGYYSSGNAAIGRQGDFYTNVSVGPVYGEVLAGQFVEMWEALGSPPEFTLVEQGAADGQLARDILDALSTTPLAQAPLVLIEPSPVLRTLQEQKLAGCNVSWVEDAGALSEICGVHYSNELFDAFPVHVVRSTGRGWVELFVDRAEGKFTWIEGDPTPGPGAIIAGFPTRPNGYTTEICLAHRPLLSTLAEKLTRGFLLAVDYGMSRESLLAEHRTDGTLSCYHNHRRDARPLESPGQKDITAHVNFSLVADDAVAAGWHFDHLTDQHHFLVGAATAMLLALDGIPPDQAASKKIRALRALLHPEHMGRKFQAILFSRGAPGSTISGFRHARKNSLEPRVQVRSSGTMFAPGRTRGVGT